MFVTNLHTLLLILGINKLLLGLLIYVLKTETPNVKGIAYWAYGSIITAIGIIVYAFIPFPAPVHIDFIYSFFLNLFVLGGDCIFLAGFWVFAGKPVKKYILFGIPALSLTNVIVFTLFYNVIWVRFFVNAFIGAGLYLYSAFVLRKIPLKSLGTIFKITSDIYFFYALVQIVRGILAIIYKPVNPVESNVVSLILIAISGVLMIVLTFNLIVIITTSINDQLGEQIQSKNKLYAIVSHDLRGPLGNLFNYIQLLKSESNTPGNGNHTKYIDEMVKISLSARFLLENLLNWSRSQLNEIKVNAKGSDLVRHVSENVAMVKNFADNKKIRIVVNPSGQFWAWFDPDMLGIVVRNIVHNAIKFTNEGGTIVIRMEKIENHIEVRFEDNGIGMDPQTIKTILDEKSTYATRGTNGEKGSGFGLVICKEFVEMNGGCLMLDSMPGKGTIISFTIPLHKNDDGKQN
jgi:signal transduction histidine kinase